MIEDARRLPPEAVVEADICIVGAGPAGITLALELSKRRLRVVLLESGGLEFEDDTQDLAHEVGQGGIPTDSVADNRLRQLGGTSGHWNGWCRPLDPWDFAARPWIPHSGWPIGPKDLEPFLARAHELVQLPGANYDPRHWLSQLDPARFRLLPLDPELLSTILFLFSPPTRFGEVYRPDLEKAAGLRTLLHANLVDIGLDSSNRAVSELTCATLSGGRFRVRTRHAVLAAGAVENARLLLSSNRQESGGVANRHDLVGRFFMQHPSERTARLLPSDRRLPLDFYFDNTVDGQSMIATLQVPFEEQRRRGMLNHTIHVYGIPYRWPGAAETAKNVLRAGRYVELDPVAEDLRELLYDLDNMAAPLTLPLMDGPLLAYGDLNYRPEQAPNPDSRVRLGDQRDALGMRRVEIDWRLGELDLHTLREGHRLLGAAMAQAGLGRVRARFSYDQEWLSHLRYLHGGHHHYGTTRMADDPSRGVVDGDGKVFGLENLWIAGSSVFPTSGCANPTLTIVALAARQADHLARIVA